MANTSRPQRALRGRKAQTAPIPVQNQGRRRRRPRNRNKRKRAANRFNKKVLANSMSANGLAFLKCAFAAPDFNTDPGQGIPDTFQGKALVKKHVLTTPVTFTAGTRTCILVLPVPGVAYYRQEAVPPASFSGTTFTPVEYPGFNQLFGVSSKDYANNVNAFRFASLAAGLYPTSNMMQFSGSVQVYKVPCQQSTCSYGKTIATTEPLDVSFTTIAVNGLEAVDNVPPDNFSGSFIDGAFSQSTCNEPEFEFNPIVEGNAFVPPSTISLEDAGMYLKLGGSYTGMGTMDAICIVVTTPADAVNTAVLKVWSCVEYRVNPISTLYEFAKDSPAHDPLALEAYRSIAKQIPVAVRADQNATFWERVRAMLKSGLSIASAIPGPIGMAATGIQGISSALESMLI